MTSTEKEVKGLSSDEKKERKNPNLRVLAESIVMVALATVLYFTRVFTFPEGGSVTLGSMTPLILLSLRRGARVGVTAGVVYGMVILSLEPFIFSPIQVLLDYPIAFGALGLAGLWRAQPIAATGLGIFGRFLAHFVSGVVFFASFAPEGESPALYSAVYNASYLVPEFVIGAVIIYVLVKRGVLTAYL